MSQTSLAPNHHVHPTTPHFFRALTRFARISWVAFSRPGRGGDPHPGLDPPPASYVPDRCDTVCRLRATVAGYGFVDFETAHAAELAVKALQANGVQAQMAKVRMFCVHS